MHELSISADGTKRIDFKEGYVSVIIPTKNDKYAVCVSCQIGCPMGCTFCHTGKFKKNLTADEIVNQVKIAKEIMDKLPYSVVFMGMGEPMLNFKNIVLAMERIHNEFQIRYKRITISTSGVNLDKLLDMPCNIAISLHSPFEQSRKKLMPGIYRLNNKLKNSKIKDNKIKEILNFAGKYAKKHPNHELMIEYALMKNVNDSDKHIGKLLRYKWPKQTNFNFIEFNDKGELSKTEMKTLFKFKNAAIKKGYKSFVRYSRGADIKAACGMLNVE